MSLARRLVGDYEEALAELRASGARVAEEPKRNIMTFGIGYSTDIHAILEWCRQEVRLAGGETLTGMTVVTELTHDGGSVTGVMARDADGRVIRFDAPAVVLTTGGFQGARDELTRHIGPNADRLLLRSNPGSVGDGLRLARAAGSGGTTAMSTFYGHLLPYPGATVRGGGLPAVLPVLLRLHCDGEPPRRSALRTKPKAMNCSTRMSPSSRKPAAS